MNSPPCRLGNARDVQGVGSDVLDAGAQGVQHVAQVLHMRLGGGIADDRLALGGHGRHDDVLGGGDAGLVQQDVRAGQAIGTEFEHAVVGDLRAQLLQRQDVRVQPAAADDVAAGRWQAQAPARGRDRSGQQDGGPNAPAQIRVEIGRSHAPGRDAPGVAAQGPRPARPGS